MPGTDSLPKFQITLDSKDGASFPSFASSEVEGGDASKITLSMIRQKASVSSKLKFTADGKNFISDTTALKYYMLLTGEKLEDMPTDKIPTICVKLIPNAAMNQPVKPHVEQPQIQRRIWDMLSNMDGKDAAKPDELKRLSESVVALAANPMNLPTITGIGQYPEPMELTETQWERILSNNRALHGYYSRPGDTVLKKAPKRVFDLVPLSRNGGTAPANETDCVPPLPPVPPFHIHDDAKVIVIETRDAFQSTLAEQGFSSVVVEASSSGTGFGVSASASMAYQEEHSKASKQVKDVPVQALQVAYKFPRAVVDLNVFCLQLTSQCIADAKAATTVDMVDQFYRDYGNAFVTRFTLGGELYSSRILTAEEQSSIIKTKEKVKAAASFSFSSPWTCGSASVTKVESNESTAGEQELHHNLQLAWEARGGDTLLCTNPPQWANTVKDYRLWRIMDQQQVVNMVSFIKEIDVGVGDHLESPKTGGGDDENKILDVIRQVLETKKTDVLASNIKKFYKSDNFEIEEYNKLLGEDEVAMKTKKAWRNLNIEEKRNVGWLAYQKNVISIH